MGKTDLTLPEGTNIPNHVAIIPDGNRRWARAHGLPAFEGHRRGFDIAPTIARAARKFGIHTFTVWAFSTENWNRSQEEVSFLMKLYEKFIDQHLKEAQKEDTKIIHLGRKDRIPVVLRKKIENAEETTKDNKKYILNVALDYGGHDEILRAVDKIVKDIQQGKLTPEELHKKIGKYNEKYPYYYFKHYLDTEDQPYPYPDLTIRTSGEKRISGLLCWQIAYTEFYWEPDHFPDFTPEKLRTAVIDYSYRHRRFGGN